MDRWESIKSPKPLQLKSLTVLFFGCELTFDFKIYIHVFATTRHQIIGTINCFPRIANRGPNSTRFLITFPFTTARKQTSIYNPAPETLDFVKQKIA